jgi:hypothetical protein
MEELTQVSVPAENKLGVQEGQIWDDLDNRRPRKVMVVVVDSNKGVARCVNTLNNRRSTIRLDRFCPSHHMKLVPVQVDA